MKQICLIDGLSDDIDHCDSLISYGNFVDLMYNLPGGFALLKDGLELI